MGRTDHVDLRRHRDLNPYRPMSEVDRKRLYGPIVTDTPGVWERVWKALGGKL